MSLSGIMAQFAKYKKALLTLLYRRNRFYQWFDLIRLRVLFLICKIRASFSNCIPFLCRATTIIAWLAKCCITKSKLPVL